MINLNYKNQIEDIIILIKEKKFQDALTFLEKLINKYPDDFFLENFYGTVFLNLKEFNKAETFFRSSIKNNNKFSSAYFNLGLVLFEKKNFKEAIIYFLETIKIQTDHSQALFYIAKSYQKLNLYDESNRYFKILLNLNDSEKSILLSIAKNYIEKKDFLNAITYLENYRNIDNLNFECLYLLGWAFYNIKEYKKALIYYTDALKIKKESLETYHGIGLIYQDLRFFDLAVENFQACLRLDENYLPALNNLGVINIYKNNFFEAIEFFEKYLQIDKTNSGVHLNIALAYFAILNFDKGLNYFEQSIKGNSLQTSFEKYLFSSLYIENFKTEKYFFLAKEYAKTFNINKVKEYKIDFTNKNLIIGFVGGDFREHAVAYQITGLFRELKNYDDIKIFIYSNNSYEDNKTLEIKSYVNKFENIFGLSDEELFKKIVDDKVNILIDLSGYTSYNRLPVFLYKAAPIQITGFGFLQTSGLSEIDYIFADKNTIFNENNFSEKTLKFDLTWSTLDVNNINFKVNDLPAVRNNYVTFGAFNNFQKLNEKTFKLWSKILLALPTSKILFNNHTFKDSKVKKYIQDQFKKNKISEDRILIEIGGNREKILKDYNKIDILLDTYPYGGGTTSLEAAWMCVPILTITGEKFVSRGATSVNCSSEMSDWNCLSEEEYVIKAVNFSENINNLSKIKNKLISNRLKNKIFDNNLFAKNFYILMRNIWINYLKSKKINA